MVECTTHDKYSYIKVFTYIGSLSLIINNFVLSMDFNLTFFKNIFKVLIFKISD